LNAAPPPSAAHTFFSSVERLMKRSWIHKTDCSALLPSHIFSSPFNG